MQKNPWGDSPGFEQLKHVAKPAKKAAADVVTGVITDVKQSATGEAGSDEKAKQAQQQQLLSATRQNLEQMNMAMKKAREERKRRQEQAKQVTQTSQAKEEKKVFEGQKKETVLQKLLKTRAGTKEAMQRTGG